MSFFDISLETANTLYTWGWRGSIFGAIITAIAVISLMWGTRFRDHDFESKVSETTLAAAQANERAAELELAAEKAKSETEKLKNKTAALESESARTNERAANAERQAAEATLELARFKAPRSLTALQQNQLRDQLKSFSGVSVDILRFGETTEIMQLNAMLTAPLTEAGWSPRSWNTTGAGAAMGIIVMVKNGSNENIEKAANALLTALQAVGIASSKWEPPDKWSDVPGMLYGPSWDAAAPIRMIIGSKP